MSIGLNSIIKLFQKGNCCVVGLRGTGKDMLFANVAVRRKIAYISNTDYGGDCIPFDYKSTLALNGNSYRDFIRGEVKPYSFPFEDGTDIYLADAGVYFPSQECSFLDRDYKGIPLYMALSRHLGQSNVHVNVQNLERCWTKIREQSDTYIRCLWCKVIFGFVVQAVLVYERADACQMRVPPCPYKPPLFCPREARELWRMKVLDYRVQHGDIKPKLLIYRNKSKYNTRIFKQILEGGQHEENT